MTTFLREQDIKHKIWAGKDVTKPGNNSQFGKAITIYATKSETLRKIADKSIDLGKRYKGIAPELLEQTNANLQYELPVPGTNNILYYTVEKVNNVYLGDSNSVILPDGKTRITDYEGRSEFMRRTWGQGPLDVFWETNPHGAIGQKQEPKKPAVSKASAPQPEGETQVKQVTRTSPFGNTREVVQYIRTHLDEAPFAVGRKILTGDARSVVISKEVIQRAVADFQKQQEELAQKLKIT